MKNKVSNCCGAEDRIDPISELKYSEIEICPKCQEHCRFIEQNNNQEEKEYGKDTLEKSF